MGNSLMSRPDSEMLRVVRTGCRGGPLETNETQNRMWEMKHKGASETPEVTDLSD